MKLSLLLCLCSLDSSVLASLQAGPYQVVFLWYAYRLETAYYEPGNTLTARGCVPKINVAKGCLFDEFIKYIQASEFNIKPFTGTTGIGDTLSPDVEDAVAKLRAVAYVGILEVSRLVNGGFILGKSHPFSEWFDIVMENTRITRVNMQQAGIDESNSAELEGIRRALIGVTEGRRAELFKNQIQDFEKWHAGQKYRYKIFTKTRYAHDGTIYQELDTDKIIQGNPGMNRDLMKSLQEWASAYTSTNGKKNSDPQGLRHYNAMSACAEYESALLAPPVNPAPPNCAT